MISRWKDIKASWEIGVVVAVVEVGGPDIPDTRCYGGSSGRIGEGRLGFLGRGMNSSWVRGTGTPAGGLYPLPGKKGWFSFLILSYLQLIQPLSLYREGYLTPKQGYSTPKQ